VQSPPLQQKALSNFPVPLNGYKKTKVSPSVFFCFPKWADVSMLTPMLERVFMGWEKPLLGELVEWLLAHEAEFPDMLVVVPTAQSGRRLRETLAAARGGILSPPVVTPGSLLQTPDTDIAAEWVERLAWMEVLEGVEDWSEFHAIFPEPPEAGGEWTSGFSQEMVKLRHTLQEGGLTLKSSANRLSQTVEADRWQALAVLETRMETQLRTWNLRDRSRVLAEGIHLPENITRIVLAGVVEIPPILTNAFKNWPGKLTALIAAPEAEQSAFSELGLPLECWSERPSPWPENGVSVVADARQQALLALKLTASAGTPSDDLALGTADAEVGAELARAFNQAGWPAFHPAAPTIKSSLSKWWDVWAAWLHDPSLAIMADLLALPETSLLVSGKSSLKATTLAEFRDRWMVLRAEDLRRRLDVTEHRNDFAKSNADELLAAVDSLEKWRTDFLRDDFSGIATRLMQILARTSEETAEAAQAMCDWLENAAPLMRILRRPARFWIDMMISEAPSPSPLPPDGRVIDVQGWLELFHEPGNHLVLCGMNEGKVPARSGGDPWLSEAGRKILGMIRDSERAARDAYLYQAMCQARKTCGRVDIICGKSTSSGDSLLPSRVLLASTGDQLAKRVKILFRDVEPADAGLRRSHDDWKWTPPKVEPPTRLSVTSLRDYLACPFRYYLKHVLRMQNPEPDRGEWNQRDFGSVAHEVLENWGRDPDARDFCKTEAIHDWLVAELNRVVSHWFGSRAPLAIRIQRESLIQRFQWFAQTQAVTRAEGWEIIDVERKIEIPTVSGLLVAMIDRVDRHEGSGQLRVIDYKTGKVDSVEKSHRTKITNHSKLPAHLEASCPAVHECGDSGKPTSYLWKNLQLPLYAAAWVARGETLPLPCYFTVATTAKDTGIHPWLDFNQTDLEAAIECAMWIADRVSKSAFWPPAEKVQYDDYRILEAGSTLEHAFQHES